MLVQTPRAWLAVCVRRLARLRRAHAQRAVAAAAAAVPAAGAAHPGAAGAAARAALPGRWSATRWSWHRGRFATRACRVCRPSSTRWAGSICGWATTSTRPTIACGTRSALTGEKSWVHGICDRSPRSSRSPKGGRTSGRSARRSSTCGRIPGITLRRSFIKFADFWGLEREFIAGVQKGLYRAAQWFQVLGSARHRAAAMSLVVDGRRRRHLAGGAGGLGGCRSCCCSRSSSSWAGTRIVFGHSRYHLPLMPIFGLYARGAVARAPAFALSHRFVRMLVGARQRSARCWRSGFGRSPSSISARISCALQPCWLRPPRRCRERPGSRRRPSEHREPARFDQAHSRRAVRSGRHALPISAGCGRLMAIELRDAGAGVRSGTARPARALSVSEGAGGAARTIDRAAGPTAQLEVAAARRRMPLAEVEASSTEWMIERPLKHMRALSRRRRRSSCWHSLQRRGIELGVLLGLSGRRQARRRWASPAGFRSCCARPIRTSARSNRTRAGFWSRASAGS